MGYDVFISYSSHDKLIADAVCATLESNGIRCWIAPRDIVAGVDWSDAIIDAITECQIFVLVLSEASNKSEQVKREVQNAVSEGKPILPFRIEEVALSKHMRYFIGTPHWLDAMTPPMERHLQRMAQTVGSLMASIGEKGIDLDSNLLLSLPPEEIGEEETPIIPAAHVAAPSPVMTAPSVTVARSFALSDQTIAIAEKAFAEYMGPLAKVLVKRAARDAQSSDDFYQRLSEQLSSPTEKAKFLKKVCG